MLTIGRILRNTIVFLVFATCSALGASSEGKLTVTATVVTSVSLVTDADGTQRILIANAPDPADNVSTLVFSSYAFSDPASTNPSTNPKTSKMEGAATSQRVIDPSRKPIRRGSAISYRRSVQRRED
jgi:hypothetical protein